MRPTTPVNRQWISIVVAGLLLAGCERSQPPAGHDSAPHGGTAAAPRDAADSKAKADHDHDADEEEHHAHAAPHGGQLVPLGEHFANIELVLDVTSGQLTAYVLDGCAENPIRLQQHEIELVVRTPSSAEALPLRLAAVANLLTGETVGDTSQFSTASRKLAGVNGLQGTILSVVVRAQELKDIGFEMKPSGPTSAPAHP